MAPAHDVAPESHAASIATRVSCAVQASFLCLDAFTRGLTRLRRWRDRCDAHAIGCWYGAAHLQRVMRCPQPQSGHRRGCQVLRCYSTPHSLPQANSKRPHSINRCEERLFVGNYQGASTPCAPRSDLHHRSGRGAFERLRASSPEVAKGCRDDGRWGRSAAHSRADSELKTTVCIIV